MTLLLLFGAWSISIHGQSRTDDSTIHFALTSGVLELDVNQNDAIAATRLWAATIGRASGLWETADAVFFQDKASLAESINQGATDIVAMSAQEFIEWENRLNATPCLTYMQGGRIDNQFLLITRQDSGINSIRDLHGKRMAMPKGGRNMMIPLWLDVIFGESGIQERESFLKEIREVQKPTQAILPVFFKQIDAGVALKSVFETAAALNPQIGKQLKVIAVSPQIVMLVVCMRKSLGKELRDRYVKQGLKLHEAPAGLQQLNIIKLDRLVAWDPSYFDNVRDLIRRQGILKSAQQVHLSSKATAEGIKNR
jgi:phosphonate transport system substrate-binding protein